MQRRWSRAHAAQTAVSRSPRRRARPPHPPRTAWSQAGAGAGGHSNCTAATTTAAAHASAASSTATLVAPPPGRGGATAQRRRPGIETLLMGQSPLHEVPRDAPRLVDEGFCRGTACPGAAAAKAGQDGLRARCSRGAGHGIETKLRRPSGKARRPTRGAVGARTACGSWACKGERLLSNHVLEGARTPSMQEAATGGATDGAALAKWCRSSRRSGGPFAVVAPPPRLLLGTIAAGSAVATTILRPNTTVAG
mmetsp:Transcript_1135/g.3483  ORF Transcript_1135/g.3483 Transcript_1135/m.3483 type:complete len:252 (-) Transcript_1135:442-1197(-)